MTKSDIEDRIRELLHELRLKDAAAVLDQVLPAPKEQRIQVLQVIEQLLLSEVHRRRERRIERRLTQSKLPERPTLESFDFDFQPNLDRALIMELANLAWLDRQEDLLLVGQSGVGKSHIAKALCLRACGHDHSVLYSTCADLMTDLISSLADDTLKHRLKRYLRPQLLLIDDLGYDPIEQDKAKQAQLLYKVLDARNGRVSTIVTSNLPVEQWAEYLGSHYLTVALLDRLLYRATTVFIEGPSYRLAQHQKRQSERGQPATSAPAVKETKASTKKPTGKKPTGKKPRKPR